MIYKIMKFDVNFNCIFFAKIYFDDEWVNLVPFLILRTVPVVERQM